jgi:hypothetical protein
MARHGRCVTCGALGKLTLDHVPPRSAVPARPIEIRRLGQILSSIEQADPPRRGFAAPDFRSICARCNNERLGAVYDPALVAFADRVRTWVRSTLILTLPQDATVQMKPALVARAVIGHILAAVPERKMQPEEWASPANEAMRDYFLGDSLALPPILQLVVWPYASSRTVLARQLVRVELPSQGPYLLDVLKFYPVAFALLIDQSQTDLPHLRRIYPEMAGHPAGEIQFRLPLTNAPHKSWPESPGETGILLVSTERVFVIDRAAPARATS